MANTWRNILAIGVLGVACFKWQAAVASEALTILVRVSRCPAISRENLLQAEMQTARSYGAIGVRLQWVHDDEAAGDSGAGSALTVRLLLVPTYRSLNPALDERMSEEVLGVAAGAARRAYVYCDRVLATAASHPTHYVNVLGLAMAHELGHLVLMGRGHSHTGIMRPSIHKGTRLDDFFTPSEAKAIRSYLSTLLGTQRLTAFRVAEAPTAP